MDFKFRAVHNNNPPPTASHSLSVNGTFSGLPMPLSGEAALRREIEKEQIRREILRRIELEEEVRRELAMEKELGVSIPRPLMNMQGLVSQWTNSTLMNHVSVGIICSSQPPLILPPAEINPSPEITDKGKVIVLDKPDRDLFNAKRKATTPPDSEIEPLAFCLKKKLKEVWSCTLCEIKATSESGLNAHFNGKKHKAREAHQNRKIARRNQKSGKNVMSTQTVVATTELGVDAEKDQQLLQPFTALEAMNETVVDKGVVEIKKEEQLVKMVADDDTSARESKNEKFVAMMVGKNMTETNKEEQFGDAEKDQQLLQPFTALEAMNETVVDKGVEEIKKEQLVKMVAGDDTSATESKNEKFVAMMVGKNITESENEEQFGEIVADNGASVIKFTNEDKLVEMMVSNDVIEFENGGLLVEKSQSVGCLESKKDAAIVEAEKISSPTKKRKVENLWCEICEISTFSRAVMEGHIKGKKHMKKMRKYEQSNASPPSTLSVSQKAPPMLIKDA